MNGPEALLHKPILEKPGDAPASQSQKATLAWCALDTALGLLPVKAGLNLDETN